MRHSPLSRSSVAAPSPRDHAWYASGMALRDARDIAAAAAISLAEPERGPLPLAVRAALDAYRTALREAFGERLKELRLFGSYARQEARHDSDVDVFVSIEGLTHAERDVAFDLAYGVELRGEWVGLAPLVYSTEQAGELRARERRLLCDIDREGIAL
jgi:predicted nucleotidyltransferase